MQNHEKEIINLKLAKDTMMKERREFEKESKQWKNYEAAWQQIKTEFGKFRMKHSDTKAELEGLKAAATAAKVATQAVPASVVPQAPPASQPAGVLPQSPIVWTFRS